MKIKRKSRKLSSKKITIIAIIITLIIGCVLWIYAFYSGDGSDNSNKSDDSTSKDSKDSSSSENSVDKNNDTSTNNSSSNQSEGDDNELEESSNDTSTYISTPIEQPSASASFPIENEHYKIVQNSSSSYTVTLYPIVNNPEYSDYSTQLKAYKNEVTSYLTNRIGDISKISITWLPADANNI